MHELTEKIRFYLGPSPKELDEADCWIQRWLREKANEIVNTHKSSIDSVGNIGHQPVMSDSINKILGLTNPSPEPEYKYTYKQFGYCAEHKTVHETTNCKQTPLKPEKEYEQDWCKHIKADYCKGHLEWSGEEYCAPYFNRNYFLGKDINFCPICGTPRPTRLTLKERLAEELKKLDSKYCSETFWEQVAEAAITFLTTHRGEGL